MDQITRVTKIRFREDSLANWERVNPVLASGEPGYVTNTSMFKIGDGKKHWKDLRYQTNEAIPVNEVSLADGLPYVRVWNPGSDTGHWEPLDLKRKLADLMVANYDEELDMRYNVFVPEIGTHRPVFGIRKLVKINAPSNTENHIELLSGICSLVDAGGTIKLDNSHVYKLPFYKPTAFANIYWCAEDQKINLESKSNVTRSEQQNHYADIWLLYTKV